MIKQVNFTKVFKKNWKISANTKAAHHNAGIQFFKEGVLINLVPYTQITEIIYGD